MRYFYTYTFQHKKIKDNQADIFDVAVNLIKSLNLSYNNYLFEFYLRGYNKNKIGRAIMPFEKLFKQFPQMKKFLTSKIEVQEQFLPSKFLKKQINVNENLPISNADYFYYDTYISNCIKGSWKFSDIDLTDIDLKIFSGFFQSNEVGFGMFCFNEIPWFGKTTSVLSPSEGLPIGLMPFCSGIYVFKDTKGDNQIYISFELDENNHNVDQYIEQIETELGCKYFNHQTYVYQDPKEKKTIEKLKKKHRKLLKKIKDVFWQNFYFNVSQDNSTISVSKAIKTAINETDYIYTGSFNGCYIINLTDRHNNQIKTMFDYSNRCLGACVNYEGAAFRIRYNFRDIKTVRSQTEVEMYVQWVLSLINDNRKLFDEVAKYFPPSPLWLKSSEH